MQKYIALLAIFALCSATKSPSNMRWQYTETKGFHPPKGIADVAIFNGPGAHKFGFFGGLNEGICVNCPGQDTNDYFNQTFLFDASTSTWTRINDGLGVAPVSRAFHCAEYHSGTNKVYMFGGAAYSSDFTSLPFYNDIWALDMSTHVWTQLSPSGSIPSARGAHACALVDNNLWMFSGGQFPPFTNELWKYNIPTNHWTLVGADTTSPSVPVGRNQHYLERIPGEQKLILHAGETFISIPDPPFGIAVTLQDMWTYKIATNTWTQLAITNPPTIKHTQQAHRMVNDRYLVLQNGDAQGNLTTDDTCPPPLECNLPNSQTSDTFVYDLQRERFTMLDLPATVPPTRRSKMTRIGNFMYLVGGYGWDGVDGVGRIDQPYTWKMELTGVLLDD